MKFSTLYRKKKKEARKVRQTVQHTINHVKKGVDAVAVIMDYISEGGAHIKVNDASMTASQKEIEQAYQNWGRIAREIFLDNIQKGNEE